jgi:superfamily II DNA/RNA helicase
VAEVADKTRFHELNLPEPVMHAIADAGFQYCTPIQAEILPATINGRDAFGRAQTGTGKTAAFLITVLTRLLARPRTGKIPAGTPRVLIIAPTRELVLQIAAVWTMKGSADDCMANLWISWLPRPAACWTSNVEKIWICVKLRY